MTLELTIRQATSIDQRAIHRVNRLAWENAYTHIFTPAEIRALFDNHMRQHATWLQRRRKRLPTFVAQQGNTIIGFIGCSLLDNDEGEVTTLYVHPHYQQQGVGKRLWQRAMQTFREQPCTGVWVWVLEKAAAMQFYKEQGCVCKARGTYSVGTHAEVACGCYKVLTTPDAQESA